MYFHYHIFGLYGRVHPWIHAAVEIRASRNGLGCAHYGSLSTRSHQILIYIFFFIYFNRFHCRSARGREQRPGAACGQLVRNRIAIFEFNCPPTNFLKGSIMLTILDFITTLIKKIPFVYTIYFVCRGKKNLNRGSGEK